jgi:hypothetical protein
MNDKQHNEDLSGMAPKLNAIQKRELHSSPEGYFDSLSENILAKINEAPVLNSIEKKELYEAPSGYFDSLSENILAKINEAPVLFSLEKKELIEAPAGYFEKINVKSIINSPKDAKIIPLRTTLLRWTAVAASVTVIVMASFYLFGDNENSTKSIASVEVSQEDYTNYLMDELQEDELYAYVSENQPQVSDSTDALVDYLINESSDYELENIE